MQKAAEDLKAQQEREAEEKKKIIAERIPKLDIDNLNDGRWLAWQPRPFNNCSLMASISIIK